MLILSIIYDIWQVRFKTLTLLIESTGYWQNLTQCDACRISIPFIYILMEGLFRATFKQCCIVCVHSFYLHGIDFMKSEFDIGQAGKCNLINVIMFCRSTLRWTRLSEVIQSCRCPNLKVYMIELLQAWLIRPLKRFKGGVVVLSEQSKLVRACWCSVVYSQINTKGKLCLNLAGGKRYSQWEIIWPRTHARGCYGLSLCVYVLSFFSKEWVCPPAFFWQIFLRSSCVT